jgi:DNA (cytosine-5)-methyltransferase 1
MKKVLNLYAGIGGNRKLWTDVEVTAVEIEPKIVEIYSDFFPDDKVVITDAHQYLLDHYDDGWDFIWSSPPCPTHSRARWWGLTGHSYKAVYPDMTLWQEIIFLRHHPQCRWVVENVKGYYEPLVMPQIVGRHYIWSNFYITPKDNIYSFRKDETKTLENNTGFHLENISCKLKTTVLRNCVEPELGLHIFNCAFKYKQETLI